jgi:hypothetical protein
VLTACEDAVFLLVFPLDILMDCSDVLMSLTSAIDIFPPDLLFDGTDGMDEDPSAISWRWNIALAPVFLKLERSEELRESARVGDRGCAFLTSADFSSSSGISNEISTELIRSLVVPSLGNRTCMTFSKVLIMRDFCRLYTSLRQGGQTVTVLREIYCFRTLLANLRSVSWTRSSAFLRSCRISFSSDRAGVFQA